MTADIRQQLADLMRASNAALAAKDPGRALALLADAAQLDPKDPDIPYNRAVALRMMNDVRGAVAAADAALALEPYHLPAIFAKGALLESLGFTKEAAVVYRNGLVFSPGPQRLPPSLADAHMRAQAAVDEDNARIRDYFAEDLDALTAKHGRSELKRFDECVRIFTGHGKRYFPEPTMLLFPAIPPVAFFDRALFPWLEEFEAETPVVKKELADVLTSPAADEFAPYVAYPPGAPVNQWGELNHSKRWSSWFFWKDGEKIEAACERAPKTAALLDRTPIFRVEGYGPAAMFSSLAAKAHIPPHTGSTNVRSVLHLPLDLPGPAWFRVGNERREWRIGEAWVFDDSIEHEARNEAETTRTILIIDVWNPYLTEPERELVSALLPAIRRYRSAAG